MQSPIPPARSTVRVRRVLVIAGVVALAVVTAGCRPDQGLTGAATRVGHTSTKPPASSPAPTATPSAAKPNPPIKGSSTPSTTSPKPVPAPVIILARGDSGPKVRSAQARLRQIGWFEGDVSDVYGTRTVAAVKGFQAKRGYAVTGDLDERTYDRLVAMTRRPSADELANVKPKPQPATSPAAWDVDPRCLTGRVMCISKTTRRLTWVIDGVPQYSFAVRFGSDELPTREGVFHVYKKQVDVISNLYHTPMPYSMFFSGGQAVHYSSNFARLGYAGASHGCVNVRTWPGIIRLYNESRIGDAVVIHW
jgi:peptidoglycan hydrolase-like protein with peptidoglycan-binding domain